MKRTTFTDIVAILFSILFLYTGISKLTEYTVFSNQLAESPALAPLAPVIAIGLPILEIIIAAALFIPLLTMRALYACLTLMTLFTIYIILILQFSTELPCSCGGLIAELSWSQHIVFNIVFIVLALVAILLERAHLKRITIAI